MEGEIFDNNEIFNIVIEIGEEDRTFEDLTKDYTDKIEKLEEALLNYTGENDLKLLKTEFPDNWIDLTRKLAYPYEYLKSVVEYQKTVNNLQKQDSSSKMKNKCPTDKQLERTKEIIKLFIIRKGRELTRLFIKSDVSYLHVCLRNLSKCQITNLLSILCTV